jgi:hypothetical protein
MSAIQHPLRGPLSSPQPLHGCDAFETYDPRRNLYGGPVEQQGGRILGGLPRTSALIEEISNSPRSTPIMRRLHDPDHILSNATAWQLIKDLRRSGITVTMKPDVTDLN